MAVVVALLHDVLDDTKVSYQEVEADFGPEVAKMVEKVSSLSSLNQLLRRNKRQRLESKLQVPTPPPPPPLSPNHLLLWLPFFPIAAICLEGLLGHHCRRSPAEL